MLALLSASCSYSYTLPPCLLFSSLIFSGLHLHHTARQENQPQQPNQLSLMAVEAPHMNLFPSQLLTNREIMKPNHNHPLLNADQMDAAMALPSSLLPCYQSTTACDPTSMNKADSGLTYHIPLPRKRSRDFIAEFNALPCPQKNKLSSDSSSFLDQELLYHFHNHQSEIDRFIAQHTEKVRMELEDQRMRQSRRLLWLTQEAVVKKLKEKDEEIQRMGKLNWVLQERVKSLCVENQIWRDMAQTNEATANSLRSNLEQVLAHVSEVPHHSAADDDAQSSCGSNHEDTAVMGIGAGGDGVGRMCKKCGKRESIVLLLPCRHLCLCTMCGSSTPNCPLCHSRINASVHVNFS